MMRPDHGPGFTTIRPGHLRQGEPGQRKPGASHQRNDDEGAE
jgi:hypothetical protein